MRALIFAIAVLLAGCSGPPSSIVGVAGAIPAASVPGATTVEVFIATSRAPDDDARVFFSGERNEDLSFARVLVSIPPNHQIGQIERAQTLPPDPRREFVIAEPQKFATSTAFADAIDAEFAVKPPSDRNILLFVHGYNTDFPSAVLRAAQFSHDSNFDGIPVLFTWASRGRTLDYVYDLNSALHARDALLETGIVLNDTSAQRIDVVAHSMGNFLTVEAIRQQALRGGVRDGGLVRRGKFNAVVLAAPDIDIDLFRRQLTWLNLQEPPVYVLTSGDDKALALSRRIAGGVERAGAADPAELSALGLTVIDLSQVKDSESIHHTKFAGAPEVVQLIGSSILSGNGLPETEHQDTPIDVLGDAATGILLLPAQILTGGRVTTTP